MMINKEKVLAIIPARGGSKGLPGKNIKPLHGQPLVAWPIKAALASRFVDRVVVTTDDEAIAMIALSYGADVPFMRPAHLAQDNCPSSEAIMHALEFCSAEDGEYDYIVVLEPTSPLTDAADIDAALELLLEKGGSSVVGASLVGASHPIFCATIADDSFLKPFNRDSFAAPTRRQDVEPLYFFDGSLYISNVKKYRETATFYHEATLAYCVPAWKSLEIDTLLDFLMVDAIIQHKNLLTAESI